MRASPDTVADWAHGLTAPTLAKATYGGWHGWAISDLAAVVPDTIEYVMQSFL
jgi:hypothetical protein